MNRLETRNAPLITIQSTQTKIIRMWADVVLDKYSRDTKPTIRYIGEEREKKAETTKNKKY